ncbi:MAG TPA: hypothetical protein VF574_15940 [Allosphingosinicella sp.]|jgi:hypothetical protein
MAIEIIDGTVESAAVKRSSPTLALYDSIVIRTADGSERRLEKVAVAPDVAAALQPGTDGRFYGYKAIDHRGLFAMRTRDGRSAFAIPSGNERIMLMMAVAGLAGFVILLLVGKGIGVLALVLGVLGAIGWFKYRSTRLEGRARFDADSEYTQSFA